MGNSSMHVCLGVVRPIKKLLSQLCLDELVLVVLYLYDSFRQVQVSCNLRLNYPNMKASASNTSPKRSHKIKSHRYSRYMILLLSPL